MSFPSILFARPEDFIDNRHLGAPDFFVDLNLDQIIAALTAGKEEYNLKPFFYFPLNRTDDIRYRHEVMQDLENGSLFEKIKSFSQEMHTVREHLAQADELHYNYQKEAWFLEAVAHYCDNVNRLADDLSCAVLKSRGFLAFREYLMNCVRSERFTSLLAETRKLKSDLSSVRYSVLIKDSAIRVAQYESETDYSADVEETFKKFKQGAVQDYGVKFSSWPNMNHIEAKILDFVALLHPDIFADLDDYCARNLNFMDEAIAAFDREIQFYVAYLEHMAILERAGLKFCYPRVSGRRKEIFVREGFDLALAHKLTAQNSPVVCNDFCLEDGERILVITGPNQGGKTTFARAFGQSHYLAALGCPVPGTEAQLFLFDRLLTHFEREEGINNHRGKLEDDLVRIYHILNQATSNSIIIMNEIFTSTTLQDAVFLSKKVMERIMEFDALCAWVTFIDELASINEHVVSMVSTIVLENPTLRTFRIIRKPADGISYAMSIAEKYKVTYTNLRERIKS